MKKYSKALWVAALALSAGCKINSGFSSTMPGGGGGGGGTSGDGAGGGGGNSTAVAASCATPDDHCLQADDLLVSEPYQRGYVPAYLGKQTAPPNAAGEATFMILEDGSTKTSRVAYRSHRPAPNEIVVGALVVMLEMSDGDMYRAPKTRDEAMNHRWFAARIVSIDPVAQGHVVVAGGYRVALDALRIVEGDTTPQIQASGPEDAAFIKPEHWLVSDNALPAQNYTTAHLAYAIQPPSPQTKGEGEFLLVETAERKWHKHAWRTRPATPADVKLGAHVVVFEMNEDGSTYRGPKTRLEVLTHRWFIAKVTDTSESFKGIVTVSGGYRVQVAGLRVPIK